jgi:hypothetical protein
MTLAGLASVRRRARAAVVAATYFIGTMRLRPASRGRPTTGGHHTTTAVDGSNSSLIVTGVEPVAPDVVSTELVAGDLRPWGLVGAIVALVLG